MRNNRHVNDLTENDITDLICFCHLRWDFVYQRPQHLMSRLSRRFRVFFIEEPVFHEQADTHSITESEENVFVVKPFLNNKNTEISSILQRQKKMMSSLVTRKKIKKFIAWYYTPMALKVSSHLQPEVIVYDCMDELSAFKFAPAELKLMEAELFKKAKLVFTGGHSLYQAKKNSHYNIFPFPSSIEKEHFIQARCQLEEPQDQACISGKKFGFYGVIDERFNIALLDEVARLRPQWQFVLIGPVVKINPDDLPKRNNIHYLGGKSYKELPSYLSGWDIAMIPFEKNESTKYISPTKTPEYLAGGKPVISTSIMDVVTPYGDKKLVYIADTPTEFIKSAETEFVKPNEERMAWLRKVDLFLKNISWDNCVHEMLSHINNTLTEAATPSTAHSLKSVA